MRANALLIKYTPSGSEREGRLMERITPRADQLQHPRKNALHMKLRANALKPSEYISQVARAGALQMLEGSAAWGGAGKGDVDLEGCRANDRPCRPRGFCTGNTGITGLYPLSPH